MLHPKPGVQERIMLHLRDYADYSESVEVPFSLSQMGIANAVSIARSNVPRAIAGLKDDGQLIERQAHVTGVNRKRKAYFLTDSGLIAAEEVWRQLSENEIRVQMPDGHIVTSMIGTVQDDIPFPMRIVDVLRYMDDNGILDLRTLSPDLIERDLSKHIEKQLVTSLGDLPRTRTFFGREKELDTMVNLLEARPTTILVPGIAGIGKTATAAKLIELFTHKRNLIYHRCQDWEGSRAFLEAVAEWLSAMGSDDLNDYLSTTPVPQPNLAVSLIVEALQDTPALIVVDDLHKVGDETLSSILRGLSLRLNECSESGMVLFSRSFKMVIPEKDPDGQIIILVMPLDGLDQDAGRNLLTTMPDMDMATYVHIYNLSRGHPLVLQLINRGSVGDTFHETLEKFVEKEIFSRLTGSEKRLLGALAVFREPMPLDALSSVDLDTDLLDALVEKGLARQADSDNYDVHDLVREFLSRSLDLQVRHDLHAAACDWYRTRRTGADEVIEYLYHLAEADDGVRFVEVLEESGRGLVKAGRIELLGILDKLDNTDLEAQHWVGIQELRGDILSLQGRWDEAGTAFSEALPLAREADMRQTEGRLLSSQADIAVQRGDLDAALKLHNQSLSIFIELNDAEGAARTYNNMGSIFRRRRDMKKAVEVYDNVEALLASEENPNLVEARIRLASAFLDMNELDRARDHSLTAYEETIELEDETLNARARAVLGRFYAKNDDPELALHHYSAALDSLAEKPDQHSAVEIKMLLGQVLVDAGRMSEAIEHYSAALGMAEANDYRVLVGELLARLGEATPDRQARMDYLQRSLTVFRALGAKERMKDVQMAVHRAIMG
jgi:tetratricopeptide (TPR) repeat protein